MFGYEMILGGGIGGVYSSSKVIEEDRLTDSNLEAGTWRWCAFVETPFHPSFGFILNFCLFLVAQHVRDGSMYV